MWTHFSSLDCCCRLYWCRRAPLFVITALLLNGVCLASSRFSPTKPSGCPVLLSLIGDLCTVESNPHDLEMRLSALRNVWLLEKQNKTNKDKQTKWKQSFKARNELLSLLDTHLFGAKCSADWHSEDPQNRCFGGKSTVCGWSQNVKTFQRIESDPGSGRGGLLKRASVWVCWVGSEINYYWWVL